MSNPSDHRTRVPPRRAMFYSVLLSAFVFGALELVLTLCGVKPSVTTEDSSVGFESRIPLFVPGTGPDADDHVTASNKQRFFNAQKFKTEKPKGTARIFCLGGSTTYGRPYNADTAFSAWLAEYAKALAPQQEWDVINVGGISYASYRVVKLMKELTAYAPDYFVVYTGHNEFLEERTYGKLRRKSPLLQGLRHRLRHTRVYSLLERATHAPPALPGAQSDAQPGLRSEVHTVLDESVGPAAYRRNDLMHEHVRAQFEDSLRQMIELSRACGAKLIFVAPASSLNDCSPFKSECMNPVNEGRMAGLLHDTRVAMNADHVEEALALANSAVRLEPRYAHAHYALARALLADGATQEARNHFRIARDEDIVPLRAPSDIVDTVRRVARDANIPLVDFETLAASDTRYPAANGIPGRDLFMDHVHPTIEGHGIVARALIHEMTRAGWLTPTQALTPALDARIEKTVLARVDQEATGLALRNLAKVLAWAGKNEDAARLAQSSIELVGEDSECSFILGLVAYNVDEFSAAEGHYADAVRLAPTYVKARHNLSIVWSKLGRSDDAIRGFLHVLDAAPDHPNARYNLARAYMRAERYADAAAAFSICLDENSDDTDVTYFLGRCYLKIDDFERAREAFATTTRLNPEDAAAHYELALLDLDEDDVDSARTRLKRAIELDSDWGEPRLALERLVP
ncbi:MAG: tetratricopeptide (TPR) repeat protein [Candidatus Promineifilaceae bacterium]|jgi:tetratricopeptide (TPR) repeat protein